MATDQDQFTAVFGTPEPGRPVRPGEGDPSDTAAALPILAGPALDIPFQAEAAWWHHRNGTAPAPAHVPAISDTGSAATPTHPASSAAAAASATGSTGIHATPAVDQAVAAVAEPAVTATCPALPTQAAAVEHAVSTRLAAATATATPTAVVTPAAVPTLSTPSFTPGDLVLSIYGDGDGSGTYGDNQAAPVVLEQVAPDGTVVNQYVLPQQTTTNAAGITEYAFSGEYGSSSEGSLSLSADGQSLVIMGYGVNAATYNSGGAAVYGNAALAQSISIQGGAYAAVPRVVADINANGTVDTSTAVYGVFNTNNPRSAVTVDGSSFYISGQGVKGDTTQGVFRAADGASTATAIDTSTDTRTAVIDDGVLYVSRDSKQGSAGFTSNISSYGGEPTGATTGTVLTGISQSVTLTAAQANGINNGLIGKTVNLSPENFFFANPTTLYVADSGNPKGKGLGDGGLQKWTEGSGGTWTLDYTLSAGLNLVADTGTGGTTGLIGLAGKVSGNTVSLYATNATIGDLDQTYLFGITDSLNATTAPSGEAFTVLETAAPDTNIRGVAFAPQLACFVRGTRLLTVDGPLAVEAIRAGTPLMVCRNGERRIEPAVWVGSRAVHTATHPEPALVQPVRVLPGAFGPDSPARPLFLSPDHAVRVEGALVPVRRLVNGGSIAVVPRDDVEYFHVELAEHGILLAEGAEAESFLDSGNRAQFGGAITTLHFDPAARPVAAVPCQPLLDDEPALAALWSRLAERSEALGHPVRLPGPSGRSDPSLRLLLPDGSWLHPACDAPGSGSQRFRFPAALAAGGEARLVSRTAIPAALRPWADDRRRLGVAVSGLRAHVAGRPVELVPGAPGAPGWWEAETAAAAGTWCWTDGFAAIPLPPGTEALEVELFAVAEYVTRVRLAA